MTKILIFSPIVLIVLIGLIDLIVLIVPIVFKRSPKNINIFRTSSHHFLAMFAISESTVTPNRSFSDETLEYLYHTHPEDLDQKEEDYVNYYLSKIVTSKDTPFNIQPKQSFVRNYYHELHKCIQKREELHQFYDKITELIANPKDLLLQFQVFQKFIEIFGLASYNYGEFFANHDLDNFINFMKTNVEERIKFYTKWIYNPLDCEFEFWMDCLE